MTNSKAIYACTSTKSKSIHEPTVLATSSDHRILFLAWMSQISAFLFMDWVLNRRQSRLTLSETTREVLDDVPHGRDAFAVLWPVFAIWFWHHIVLRYRK